MKVCNFFKKINRIINLFSLVNEANASVRQTSTIGRPNSKFSDISVPTAYYEKTTAYADYPGNEFDDSDDDFGAINEDDDDFSEVVEAINPNIQVSLSG